MGLNYFVGCHFWVIEKEEKRKEEKEKCDGRCATCYFCLELILGTIYPKSFLLAVREEKERKRSKKK